MVSDGELGSQALSGDVTALAALLERHRPPLYATAVGLLNNRADALDAVQDTFVIALLRLGDLRDPGGRGVAAHGAAQRVPRPHPPASRDALGRRRRSRRRARTGGGLRGARLRDWIPARARCAEPGGAAHPHAAPLQPVHELRGDLAGHRDTGGHSAAVASTAPEPRLAGALSATTAGTPLSQEAVEAAQRQRWENFYRDLHERPSPRPTRTCSLPMSTSADPAGHWCGIRDWSAEERDAISVGVGARIVGVLASHDITVLEIDFSNPAEWPDHCPPHATFVHQLSDRRSRQLRIHYPASTQTSSAWPSTAVGGADALATPTARDAPGAQPPDQRDGTVGT